MKLYCVRHAEAEAAYDDAARPLSIKGQMDIERVARYLGQYDLHIRHIMHSGKRRAEQTACVLAKHLEVEEVTACLSLLDCEAEVEPMIEMIKTWSEDTMIVGHLPFMAKLISGLVINDSDFFPILNYPPGCIVALDHFDNQRWIINWLLRPDILPECYTQ